jgi:hypothetical protein
MQIGLTRQQAMLLGTGTLKGDEGMWPSILLLSQMLGSEGRCVCRIR